MPLPVLSPAQFTQNLAGGIAAATSKLKNLTAQSGGVIWALCKALGDQLGYVQGEVQYLDGIVRLGGAVQTDGPTNSVGPNVDSFVADFAPGFTQRMPGVAPGGPGYTVTFARLNAAPPGGVTIPVGTLVGTVSTPPASPVIYTVVADTTNSAYSAIVGGYVVPAGAFTVNATVQCTQSGTAYNVQSGSLTVILSGAVPADSVTNSTPILNGANAESNAALALRFQLWISNLASGTLGAIESAVASSATGIASPSIQGSATEAGTPGWTFYVDDGVNVNLSPVTASAAVFVDDGSQSLTSTSPEVIAAQSAVNAVRSVGITVTVAPATNVPIYVSSLGMSVSASDSRLAVLSAVQSAVALWMKSQGTNGYNPATGTYNGKVAFASLASFITQITGVTAAPSILMGTSIGGLAASDIALAVNQVPTCASFGTETLTINGTGVTVGDTLSLSMTANVAGTTLSPVIALYTVTSTDAGQSTLALQKASVAANVANAIEQTIAVTGPGAFLAAANPTSNQVSITTTSGACINSVAYLATASPGTSGHITASLSAATSYSLVQVS